MKASAVVGEARKPHLEAMFGPDLHRRLSGGVVMAVSGVEWQVSSVNATLTREQRCQNGRVANPMLPWEVFAWTAP